MPTTPEIIERAAQPYVAVKASVTMRQLPALADRLGEVFGWLAERGVDPAGPPFFRYNVIDMEHLLEVEAGVPVPAAVEGDGRVLAGILPAGKYASAIHTGPVSTNLSWPHCSRRMWLHQAGSRFFWPHPAGARRSCNFPGGALLLGAMDRTRRGRNFLESRRSGSERSWTGGARTSWWNHTGPYDGLIAAVDNLLQWAQARGLDWDKSSADDGEHWGCRLEIYRTDPSQQPDPARWETELSFRLR